MAPRPVDVEVRAVGVDGVRRHLKLLGDESGEMGEKGGTAARRVAGALLEVAHSGEVGVRSLKEITITAAEMATGFGVGGPILGAIALIGVAFYESFQRAREEMEKTREKFHEELDQMVNAGDNAALLKKARDLFLGTAASDFQDGIQALGERLAAEQGKLDELIARRAGNPFAPKALVDQINSQTQTVDALREKLDGPGGLRIRFAQIEESIVKVNNTPFEIRGLSGTKTQIDSLDAAGRKLFERMAFFNENDLANNAVFAKRVGTGFVALLRAAALDTETQKQAADIGRGLIQQSINDALNETTGIGRSGVAGALAGLDALKRQGPLVGGFTSALGKEIKELTDASTNLDESLGTLAGSTIPALASGFEGMFGAIQSGQPVFKAFAQIAVQSIAQVAAKLAAQEFAEGLAMVARSIWDFFGPNPVAGVSAAKHFEAAALFGAIAAGASAGAGSIGGYGGGGGGTGGPSGASFQSSSTPSRATVVFKGKRFLFDTSDPDDRAQLIAAFKALFGDGDIDFIFDG